ncbi:MAG: hypothetical protein D8M58_14130 [Calditrichaeota bacterium]|nr:MAG: hypothetical protein DWQ03_15370 [Calditrichota bacterium]MBL1206538.1 hypothetical protein [Calditrichota bacterium]NOG46365.1 hypothetical protein [Calditrichota bacterium]
MAGIFGFINKSKKYNSEQISEGLKVAATQGFDNPAKSFLSKEKSVGIGFAAPYFNSSWPQTSKNGAYVFQLFGEIFLPDSSLLSEKNFENGFLYPFLKSGKDFLLKLDGAFIFSLYDKNNDEMILCNDPFGNFSLHYYFEQDLFIFSSQIHAITKTLQKKAFDEQGLNEFVGLGYNLNNRTYYKDIKRLQAAEIVKASQTKLSSSKYYIPNYTYNNETQKSIIIIKDAISSSIKKRIENHNSIGAAITGGFDSRVTWGIIDHLNCTKKVKAFTHGLEDSRDISIARKISSKLKLNHKTLIFDKDFIKTLPSIWEKFTFMTEGLVPITAAHACRSWEFSKRNYKLLLDSHGGALYRRQFMKVAEKRINSSLPLPDQFVHFIKSPLLNSGLLKEHFQYSTLVMIKKSLDQYFESTNHIENIADKIDYFYINQISANRYSYAGNAQMNWVLLAHPFLNLQAFNAVQKLSPQHRRNQSIYRYIVNETSKQLKSFYLENMGMPAPYHGFTFFRYFPMVYELVLQNSLKKVNEIAYHKFSLRKFVTDYDLFFRVNFKEIKEILLRENSVFFDIVEKKELENLVKKAGDNHSYKLSSWANLITLKLFFDVFHK